MCVQEQSVPIRDSVFDATWDISITIVPASSIPSFGFLNMPAPTRRVYNEVHKTRHSGSISKLAGVKNGSARPALATMGFSYISWHAW